VNDSRSREKIVGGSDRHFIWGRGSMFLFEDSQAMPACLSNKDRIKIKTLE
jgi:hypothetical protein